MEASESTHAPDVTREGLTWINDTSPKYKMIIIDGLRECNTQDRNNQDMQWFCTSLSWPAQQHGWRFRWSWYSTYISTPLKEQTDKGEIYILPCQEHYLNPEYFSEESPLEYQDKSRTSNISSCKDYIDKHAEVVIASPDTVIFLMMFQMYPSLPCDIIFLTGKGNLKRNIPVQPLYNTLRHIYSMCFIDTRRPWSNRIGHVWTVCRDN